MLNFLAITLKVPGEMGEMAGQIANPGYMGNLLIVALFIIIVGIYGFWLDRHNMMINLFATYIGLLAINFFPSNIWQIELLGSWWGQLILFIAAVLVVAVILSTARLFRVVYSYNFILHWWQAVVSGVLYAGFLASIILSILPVSFLGQFSPSFLELFISDLASFIWLAAPIVGLLLIRGKRR